MEYSMYWCIEKLNTLLCMWQVAVAMRGQLLWLQPFLHLPGTMPLPWHSPPLVQEVLFPSHAAP
jgi:hypothetical protein